MEGHHAFKLVSVDEGGTCVAAVEPVTGVYAVLPLAHVSPVSILTAFREVGMGAEVRI